MIRRSFLKALAALPFAAVLAPRAVLAAHDEIEWVYKFFDFNCRLGICGVKYFRSPAGHSFYKPGELRMMRAAAYFVIPVSVRVSGVSLNTEEAAAAACPDLVRKAKLSVLDAFAKQKWVAYDDDIVKDENVRPIRA